MNGAGIEGILQQSARVWRLPTGVLDVYEHKSKSKDTMMLCNLNAWSRFNKM